MRNVDRLPVKVYGTISSQGSDTRMRIVAEDPSNGLNLIELDLDGQTVLHILSGVHGGHVGTSTLTVMGLDKYGLERQILNLKVCLGKREYREADLAKALAPVEEVLNAHGWFVTEYEKKWNFHRLKDDFYSISVTRFVEPETPLEDEVKNLPEFNEFRVIRRDADY